MLKQQLDKDVDHSMTPCGKCGTTGAPFKVRCESHGYTVVGKGTIPALWNRVSREEEIYRILASAQASAVTVFLGTIDMAQSYHLHGAGTIRHMLLMGYAGEPLSEAQVREKVHAVKSALAEIRNLGVFHNDVRPANALWNEESGRVLMIDFERSKVIRRPTDALKRTRESTDESVKRQRLIAG